MCTKSPNPCSTSLKPSPIATMMFKVHDLNRDVECLRTAYSSSCDPHKSKIDKVLSNMKAKLNKVDQTLKFGKHAMEHCIAREKTAIALKRVRKLNQLFKELLRCPANMCAPERRSLCLMYHQLLSMEDDLLHFTDRQDSSCFTGRCRNNDEPWVPPKDCQVRAVLLNDAEPDRMSNYDANVNARLYQRTVCCTYPEIGEPSDYGEEETRGTVFSINNRREEEPPVDNSSFSDDDDVNNSGLAGSRWDKM